MILADFYLILPDLADTVVSEKALFYTFHAITVKAAVNNVRRYQVLADTYQVKSDLADSPMCLISR